MWAMLAMAAVKAVGSAMGAGSESAEANRQWAAKLRQTTAQNKAINEANMENVLRTGYMVGIQNLQKARSKIAAAEQGYNLSVQGSEALGDTVANAAASGTVGSSVDAVQGNVKKKLDEAQITTDVNFMAEMVNHHIGIEQTLMAGKDAQRSAIDPDNTKPSVRSPWSAALGSLVGSAINNYASGSLSLGGSQSAGNAAGGISLGGKSGQGLKMPSTFKL